MSTITLPKHEYPDQFNAMLLGRYKKELVIRSSVNELAQLNMYFLNAQDGGVFGRIASQGLGERLVIASASWQNDQKFLFGFPLIQCNKDEAILISKISGGHLIPIRASKDDFFEFVEI